MLLVVRGWQILRIQERAAERLVWNRYYQLTAKRSILPVSQTVELRMLYGASRPRLRLRPSRPVARWPPPLFTGHGHQTKNVRLVERVVAAWSMRESGPRGLPIIRAVSFRVWSQ